MKSILILYQSKHGATKQYAAWLAKEISDVHLEDLNAFNTQNLNNHDIIIVGGRTYGGAISVQEWIEQNWNILQNKHVFLYTVGMVPADAQASQKSYERIPQHIREEITYRKLPGKLKFGELNVLEWIMLKLMGAKELDKTNKEEIQPILQWVKQKQS